MCGWLLCFADLGQVWYLIVSIPDLCTLTYLVVSLVSRVSLFSASLSRGAVGLSVIYHCCIYWL